MKNGFIEDGIFRVEHIMKLEDISL